MLKEGTKLCNYNLCISINLRVDMKGEMRMHNTIKKGDRPTVDINRFKKYSSLLSVVIRVKCFSKNQLELNK